MAKIINKIEINSKLMNKNIADLKGKISELDVGIADLADLPGNDTNSKDSKKYKYDMQKVTGLFTFNEIPGGTLDFNYRRYKNEILKYSLKDGETYTVPRMIAEHLRTSGVIISHEYEKDINGELAMVQNSNKKRFTFAPSGDFK